MKRIIMLAMALALPVLLTGCGITQAFGGLRDAHQARSPENRKHWEADLSKVPRVEK